MKRTIVLACLALVMLAAMASCTTMKGSGSGCKATKGFIGYGGR
jgi:predicted small secreted protein